MAPDDRKDDWAQAAKRALERDRELASSARRASLVQGIGPCPKCANHNGWTVSYVPHGAAAERLKEMVARQREEGVEEGGALYYDIAPLHGGIPHACETFAGCQIQDPQEHLHFTCSRCGYFYASHCAHTL